MGCSLMAGISREVGRALNTLLIPENERDYYLSEPAE